VKIGEAIMRGIAPVKIDVRPRTVGNLPKTFNRFFCEENALIRTNSKAWRDYLFFEAIELRSIEYWIYGTYDGRRVEEISYEEQGVKSALSLL
jgi:hypothetical protein